MCQRVSVAVAQAKVAFEHVADFAMFDETAGADDGGEFIQRFAAAFFDVGELRRGCFFQIAHNYLLRGISCVENDAPSILNPILTRSRRANLWIIDSAARFFHPPPKAFCQE